MFPISDDNPSRITPYVTWGFIVTCFVVYLWQFSLGEKEATQAVLRLGMIPARLFGISEPSGDPAAIPAWGTLFTSMFMHGGLLHLGGNMLYLWIFGDNIEDAMGHVRFIAFYLICGIAAAMSQALLNTGSEIPMIGASGAVSGVLGAYLLLHPKTSVRVLLFFGFFVNVVHVPAMIVLGVWFAGQLFSAILTPVDQPGIAFAAHIGGFVAGLVLVPLFKHKYVPLFQTPERKGFWTERRKGPWG